MRSPTRLEDDLGMKVSEQNRRDQGREQSSGQESTEVGGNRLLGCVDPEAGLVNV